MTNELKPCPFCAGEAKVSADLLVGESVYEAYCDDCFASVGFHSTEGEAVAAWNRRTQQHCRYEHTDHCTVKCSVCGREVETFHPGYRHCPCCGSYIEPKEWMRGFRSEEDMKEAGL